MLRSSYKLTIIVLLAASGWFASAARGQEAPLRDTKAAATDSQEAERRKILESDEWQRTSRAFNEWLSVQQIYGPSEVEVIKAEMKDREAHMSPQELRRFQEDMQSRLKVLTSPEAEDARMWLKQFLAVARNPEQQLGRSRPDVLNMTASEIRQEILWLQQHRESRLQAQATFDRTRSTQSQIARDQRDARQSPRQPVERSNWPSNTPPVRSQYSPRRDVLPPSSNAVYMIGPWGTPYFQLGQSPPVQLR